MKKATLMLTLLALVAAPLLAAGTVQMHGPDSAFAVTAMDSGDPTAADHPRARQAVIDFLGLPADQATQWDALLATRDAAVSLLRDQLKSTAAQLQELLGGADPDAGAVGTLVIAAKTLREGIQAADKAYLEGFEAMLDPNQQAKLASVRHAARLRPVLPAFAVFGLLPPPAQVAAR
jgi:hypothetical protein